MTKDGVRLVCLRILDEECSAGEKAMLAEVLGLAAHGLASQNLKNELNVQTDNYER